MSRHISHVQNLVHKEQTPMVEFKKKYIPPYTFEFKWSSFADGLAPQKIMCYAANSLGRTEQSLEPEGHTFPHRKIHKHLPPSP